MKQFVADVQFNHLNTAMDIQRQIYSRMSYAEKWQESLRLRQTAVAMKRAFLSDKHPDWSSKELESELRKIFLYAST